MSASPVTRTLRRSLVGMAAAWALGIVMLGSNAQAEDGVAQLSQIGQRFVDQALQQGDGETAKAGNGLPLRMQVKLGQLDSRLRLAACAKVEPYLPAGSRLWGRSRHRLAAWSTLRAGAETGNGRAPVSGIARKGCLSDHRRIGRYWS